MAFGEHWEWRAFGQIPHDLYQRSLALPPVLPDPWLMEDHYLHALARWAHGQPLLP
jgi:hypothetical protein